jgi:hypothetical protein
MAVARGDLSQMIEVDAKGEILELKVGPSVTSLEYSLTPNHSTRSTEW